jgi:hypothetical protein
MFSVQPKKDHFLSEGEISYESGICKCRRVSCSAICCRRWIAESGCISWEEVVATLSAYADNVAQEGKVLFLEAEKLIGAIMSHPTKLRCLQSSKTAATQEK